MSINVEISFISRVICSIAIAVVFAFVAVRTFLLSSQLTALSLPLAVLSSF